MSTGLSQLSGRGGGGGRGAAEEEEGVQRHLNALHARVTDAVALPASLRAYCNAILPRSPQLLFTKLLQQLHKLL